MNSETGTSGADPLVSVVIPAYKAERWIGETLESVQAQTYRNLEIIVVDDGSPDNLAKLVEARAAEDSRIRLVRKANGGLSAARNTGIAESGGELVAPIDADDLWRPDKVAKQVARFRDHARAGTEPGFVYCWSNSIDEGSRIIRPGAAREVFEGEVFDALVRENFVGNGSSPMFSRRALEAVGGYPEHMTLGSEDWALYLRVAARFPCAAVPEFLVGYRQLPGSMSKDFTKMRKAHDMVMEDVARHGRPLTKKQVRDSRSSQLLWLVFLAQPLSRPFFRLVAAATANDPLVWIRKRTVGRIAKLARLKLRPAEGRGAEGARPHFLNPNG